MRVSQYVTGRSESSGYNFSLASDSGFTVANWMRDSTRASKIRNTGVVELQASPNANGLEPSDFVLCYSEHVWHIITEENGKRVAIPTREYDYSHYLVVSAGYQQQDGISPDDTVALAAKLLCAGKFLDLYQYQRVSGERQDMLFSSFEITDAELNQAYEAYRERADLSVAFTGEKLAAFLARYWEHCWARFVNDVDARPMVLLVTSPERNNPDHEGYDITNVLVDGIVFFGQHVLPNLPSAVRQIASASFGSVVEQPSAQSGTACMVCYPTSSALSADSVYCSFENEIIEPSIDEYDVRLGSAMLNHAMPESYTRLCTLAGSGILAKNYDLARLLVMYDAILESFDSRDLQKSIVIGHRGLQQLQDVLRGGGIKDEAIRTFVLYPLEYGYVSACVQNAVPYDKDVYAYWLSCAKKLRDRSALLQKDESERLAAAYDMLLQKKFPNLTLANNPLDAVWISDEAASTNIEGGLLRNNSMAWQDGVLDPDILDRMLKRLVHLRDISRDDTADAYRDTITNACAANMETAVSSYLSLVKEKKLSGSIHTKAIEDMERMATLLLAGEGMSTQIADDMLSWYQSLGEGDQKLAEPLIAAVVQAAVVKGAATGKPQELAQLVGFYYRLPHADDTVDRAILQRAYAQGYHQLLADTELHALLQVFFGAPSNQRYNAEFGKRLLDMADAEPAALSDLTGLLKLPCDEAAKHALVQNLMERTQHEQLQPNLLLELTKFYHTGDEGARATANALLQRCKKASQEGANATRDDTMEARIWQLLGFLKAVRLPHLVDDYIARCFAEVLPPTLLSEAFVKELQAQRDMPDAQGTQQLRDALVGWSTRVLLKEQGAKPTDLPSTVFLERLCAVVGVAGVSKAELKPAVRDYCSAILTRVYGSNPKELPSAKFLDDLCQTVNAFEVAKQDLRPVLQQWCAGAVHEAQAENRLALPSSTLLQRLNSAMDACGMQASDMRDAMKDWYMSTATAMQEAAPGALPEIAFVTDSLALAKAYGIAPEDIREPLRAWCGSATKAMQAKNPLALPDEATLQRLREIMTACNIPTSDLTDAMKGWYLSTAAAMQEAAPGALPEITFVTDALALAKAYGIGQEDIREPLRAWCGSATKAMQAKNPLALPDEATLQRLREIMTACNIPASDLTDAMKGWYLSTAAAMQAAAPSALPETAFVTNALDMANAFAIPQNEVREPLQAWCIRAMQEVRAQDTAALPGTMLLRHLGEIMTAGSIPPSELRGAMKDWYLSTAAAVQEKAPSALPGRAFVSDALALGSTFAIAQNEIREPLQAWCERVASETMQHSDALPEDGFLRSLNEVIVAGGLQRDPFKPIMLAWFERAEVGASAQAVRAQMREIAKEYDIRPDADATLARAQWVRHFLQEEFDALCEAVESRGSVDQLWRLRDDAQTQLFELHYRRQQIDISRLDDKLPKCMSRDKQLSQTAYLMRMMDKADMPSNECYMQRVQNALHLYLHTNIRQLFGPSIALTVGDAPQAQTEQPDEQAQSAQVMEKVAMLRRWERWRQAHGQGVQNADSLTPVERACAECDLYDGLKQSPSDETRRRLLASYLEKYTKYARIAEADALLLAYGTMQLSALPAVDQSVPTLLTCVTDGGKNLSIVWDRYLDGAFAQNVPWAKIDLWQDEGNAYPVLAALLGWMKGPLDSLGATFRSYLDHSAFGRRAKRKAALHKHLRHLPEQSAGEFALNPMLEWLKDWNPIPKGESL